MEIVPISNRGKSNIFSSSQLSECSSAEMKKYAFCHNPGLVEVVAINEFFGIVNIVLK